MAGTADITIDLGENMQASTGTASAAAFWEWFVRNADAIRDRGHPRREELLDELQHHLQAFSEDLWFEIGIRVDGTGHLIITAEGDVDAFPAVKAMVDAAPGDIEGWEVTAFKPPRGFGFVLKRSGITITPESVWFAPLEDPGDPDFLGIEVAYPHFNPELHDEFLNLTFIMLEAGIGEMAFAEGIDEVSVGPLPESPATSGYIPIAEIAPYLSRQGREGAAS